MSRSKVRTGRVIQTRERKPPKAVAPKVPVGMLLVRRLNASDMGWFASARRRNLAAGRQRGINLQAPIIGRLLTPEELRAGSVEVRCSRPSRGEEPELRTIARPSKNWLLRGARVEGADLEGIAAGDWLLMRFARDAQGRLTLNWEPVLRSEHPDAHGILEEQLGPLLTDGTAELDPASKVCSDLATSHLGPLLERPARSRGREARSISDRLREPHILTEIMRHGVGLSTEAQRDFLQQLERVARDLRAILFDAGLIQSMKIDHPAAWKTVRRKPLTFVDGGVAAIQALGAEPLAIRVGSYTVRPGVADETRERFQMERVLVDELFESGLPGSSGLYEDQFDDLAKLRDAARICVETAALQKVVQQKESPAFLFAHGPLVNPVSPYGLEGFPDFRATALPKLLPGVPTAGRTGREANFIAVHLEQLTRIVRSRVPTIGVVERASISRVVGDTLLQKLQEDDYIDGSTRETISKRLKDYRLTDSLLFEVVLEAGEYLRPLRIDKNASNKIPNQWRDEIEGYPHPLVTYVKPSVDALPIRVEILPPDLDEALVTNALQLVLHMARLLPRYAFPVGLDIVDRYAKVPAWMSRQVGRVFSAQVMHRAMESGNPQMISMARRFLSGNARDWLFRPTP